MKILAKAAPQADTRSTRVAGLLGMVVMFAAGLVLSACNTTAGAGADLSAAGRGVSKAATETKDKL